MKSQTLSVVLATYNEEENIANCLESIKSISTEIIIVDGKSTDNTVNIAKKLNAKIISTTNKRNFHINKQIAIDKATSDWILQLDADEVIPKNLAQEIIKTINANPQNNAYFIKRKNFFLGKFLTKGGQYPDPVIRLFRKNKAKLPQQDVHEQMVVDGSIGTLSTPMEHYTARTFNRYLQNANRYTTFTAHKLKKTNQQINLFTTLNFFIFKPNYTFFLIYFRHKGFVDGIPGFIFALFSALHHPIAFMKYWELQNSRK